MITSTLFNSSFFSVLTFAAPSPFSLLCFSSNTGSTRSPVGSGKYSASLD